MADPITIGIKIYGGTAKSLLQCPRADALKVGLSEVNEQLVLPGLLRKHPSSNLPRSSNDLVLCFGCLSPCRESLTC